MSSSPGIHIGQASALYCLVLWIPMRCLFWSGVLLPLYLPPCWNAWEGTPVGSDGAEHRCSCPFDVWTPEWGSVRIVFREIICCHYVYFCFLCIWCHQKKLPKLVSEIFFSSFPSKRLIFSGLTFKSLIYFVLILVSGIISWVKQGFNFILLHVNNQVSKQHLLKR